MVETFLRLKEMPFGIINTMRERGIMQAHKEQWQQRAPVQPA